MVKKSFLILTSFIFQLSGFLNGQPQNLSLSASNHYLQQAYLNNKPNFIINHNDSTPIKENKERSLSVEAELYTYCSDINNNNGFDSKQVVFKSTEPYTRESFSKFNLTSETVTDNIQSFEGEELTFNKNNIPLQIQATEIVAEADAWVHGGNPDKKYSFQEELSIRFHSSDTYKREAFLRFDLTGLTGTILEAKLVLQVISTSDPVDHNVYFVSNDSWDEAALTWNTKPNTDASPLDVQNVSSNTVEFDVTSKVQTELGGKISLAIRASQSVAPYLNYASRENSNVSYRPKLVITYSTTGGGNSPDLVAEADAWVHGGNPDKKYSFQEELSIRFHSSDTYKREAFLRFDLTNESGTVQEAKLVMHVVSPSDPVDHNVYFVNNDSWDEAALTWNTKPNTDASPLDVQNVSSNTVEFDVTSKVQTELGGKISLAIRASQSVAPYLNYASREHSNASYRPRLIITYTSGGGNPAAPAALTATAASATQINLAWQDKSGNETGFKIERSTDGTNFSNLATVPANTTSYQNKNLSAGTTYHYRLKAYNSSGNSSSSNSANATTIVVTGLTLIDAGKNQPIAQFNSISDNSVLNLATLPNSLNIRANTSPATVGSVIFNLSGAETHNRTESGAPYALFGDVSGDYENWTPSLGNYTLTVTPYKQSGGNGNVGTPLTINFTVIDEQGSMYYAINSGNWKDSNTWSLSENGSPAETYPQKDAEVIINGYTVNIEENMACKTLKVTANGTNSVLNVKEGTLTVLQKVTIEKNCTNCNAFINIEHGATLVSGLK